MKGKVTVVTRTRLICGRSLCPGFGKVLVFGERHHLTGPYSKSTAPSWNPDAGGRQDPRRQAWTTRRRGSRPDRGALSFTRPALAPLFQVRQLGPECGVAARGPG